MIWSERYNLFVEHIHLIIDMYLMKMDTNYFMSPTSPKIKENLTKNIDLYF